MVRRAFGTNTYAVGFPRLLRRSDNERRSTRLPLIAEAKFQRRRLTRGVVDGQVRLRIFLKAVDRPDISPAMTNVPFLLRKKPIRDSRIVLKDYLAVGEEKVTDL